MNTKLIVSLTSVAFMATLNLKADSYSKLTPIGYSFQSNPFDAIGPNWEIDNAANNVIPNPNPTQHGSYSGPWDGSTLLIWTGTGWSLYEFDSETTDTTTGFIDTSGSPVAAPILGPGVGYLIDNQQGVAQSIVYKGKPRRTASLTFPVQSRPYAIGAPFLYSGLLSGILPNPGAQNGTYSGPLDQCYVEFLEVNAQGGPAGYSVYYFDSETSDTTTGFIDTTGTVPLSDPTLSYALGFFFVNESASTFNWNLCVKNSPVGCSFQSNPLDALGPYSQPDNAANIVIANPNPTQHGSYSGPWDGSSLQIWSVSGFGVYEFDSETADTTTGFTDTSGQPVAAPILGPGLGYEIDNQHGTAQNIIYEGSFRAPGFIGLAGPPAMAVGSPVLFAGRISGLMPIVQFNGSYVQFLQVDASGAFIGFSNPVYFNINSTTGFADGSGNTVAQPFLDYAEGYLFNDPGNFINWGYWR